MIKTIVFDFGNVLGFFDHSRATRKLAAHAGASSEELLEYFFGCELEDQYEKGQISTANLLEQFRNQYRFCCPDEVLAEIYGDIFWPNPEVCQLIPRLKPRFRLLLASNTSEMHARKFLRQFKETLKYFDALVLSFEIGVRKPSQLFFEHCLKLARCAPQECVFIDDMEANVAAARSCGWQGIVYKSYPALLHGFAQLGLELRPLLARGNRTLRTAGT